MNTKQTLNDLRAFVQEEHKASQAKLFEVWEKPLSKKLTSGESQHIAKISRAGASHLVLNLGENDSRFREGDMVCLHYGDALESVFLHQATIEAENDGEWLLRVVNQNLDSMINADPSRKIYADPDSMDLKPFFDKALDDIAGSTIGTQFILPLLAGELDTRFIFTDNYDDAADSAEEAGLNDQQIDAVGKGVAAKYIACIQGPPGTGKTKVISLIAGLLAAEGQRVFVSSHTHMAINNALNKIAKEGFPTAKIGSGHCVKALDKSVLRFEYGDDWEQRPDNGYVIGATPFATCSERLEKYQFDTVIFDEASQITVPLAVMAMRKARRFVFVGDHKQLPPVVLSKSVLAQDSYSVFAKLVAGNQDTSVMLSQTYRMNRQLSRWPSQQYYKGALKSVGDNADRQFRLPRSPAKYTELLSSEHALIYIESPGVNQRTVNTVEAKLVADIIFTAVEAGIEAGDIGVVTPYRNQGKAIRKALANNHGLFKAKDIVTDTVERMQGQERELIILSLCSTDKQFIKTVAPFFFQSERLNVAITRPKTKLIIIGPFIDSDFCVDARDKRLLQQLDAYRDLLSAAFTCQLTDSITEV